MAAGHRAERVNSCHVLTRRLTSSKIISDRSLPHSGCSSDHLAAREIKDTFSGSCFRQRLFYWNCDMGLVVAQVEQVIRAADQAIDASQQTGLIGILLVMIIMGVGLALAIAFRFCAPLLKDFVRSTIDLHESLKETTSRMAETQQSHGQKLDNNSTKLDGQSAKLDVISEKLNRCPLVSNQPRSAL